MKWTPRTPDASPPLSAELAVVLRKHKVQQEAVGPMETEVHHCYAVVSGTVQIMTGGQWRVAPPRTFAYFGPGMRYGIRRSPAHKGPVQVLVIQFAPPRNWKSPQRREPLRLPGHWWRRVLELDAGCDFDRHGRRVVEAKCVLQLLSNISHAVTEGQPAQSGHSHRADTLSSWVETWARAEEVIRTKVSTGLSIAELAQAVHVSPVQLRRIYAAAAGLSPKRSLTQWRMREARRMISAGQLSITRISQMLGFGSSQRFCTAFKAETGQTPGAYARNPKALAGDC